MAALCLACLAGCAADKGADGRTGSPHAINYSVVSGLAPNSISATKKASAADSALPQLPPPLYVSPSSLQLLAELPPYPVEGSSADTVDLLVVRALQSSRKVEDVREAELLAALNARVFLSYLLPKLGYTFDDAKYVKSIRLLDQIQSDMRGINRAANGIYEFRARPAARADDIQPALPPGRFLYVWAGVLSEVLPAHRQAIKEVTNRAAWLRVVSGLHFPSDLVGSHKVSLEALRAFNSVPAFRMNRAQLDAEFKMH
jgi:acid phosphatase (class A)